MKNVFVLSALAMLATIAHAHDGGTSLFRYDFKCDFDSTPHATDNNDGGYKATARVFAYDDNMQRPVSGSTRRDWTDLLSIEYHDSLVFANSAVMNSTERFVEIASPTGEPAIYVKRDHHDGGTLDNAHYEATLAIHDDRIPGHCDVHREDVSHNAAVILPVLQ